jgi:hypothetical protein
MAKSLDEKFPYPLDVIVYSHFPNGGLDNLEVKTIATILWIIKWSDGFNEVYSFEIARRVIVNYGSLFHFDENEVVWAIIRLLEKGILSSIYLGPAEDLPLHNSIVPAIKSVKVNNEELITDAMEYDPKTDRIIAISAHTLRLKAGKKVPLTKSSFPQNEMVVINNNNDNSMTQSDELASIR